MASVSRLPASRTYQSRSPATRDAKTLIEEAAMRTVGVSVRRRVNEPLYISRCAHGTNLNVNIHNSLHQERLSGKHVCFVGSR